MADKVPPPIPRVTIGNSYDRPPTAEEIARANGRTVPLTQRVNKAVGDFLSGAVGFMKGGGNFFGDAKAVGELVVDGTVDTAKQVKGVLDKRRAEEARRQLLLKQQQKEQQK